MPNPVIAKCPICAEALSVARLECASCGTRIEGSFALGRFHQLSAEQLEFLETFIKHRGNVVKVKDQLRQPLAQRVVPMANNPLKPFLSFFTPSAV